MDTTAVANQMFTDNPVTYDGVAFDAVWMQENYWRLSPALTAQHLTNFEFQIPDHVDLMSQALQDACNYPNRRLMITMPPRHGKSHLVSHWFPVWFFQTFPDKRIILASYEADTASMWGRKVRDALVLHTHETAVEVRSDTKAAQRWETTAGGSMMTAGVGGPIAGRGCDMGIIDDPIKNQEEADSQTIRDKIWDWYRSVMYTRLEPKASMVVVSTRWHEDDLIGRLLAEENAGGEKWAHLNLPAVAEEDDLLKRSVGEALWPERYNDDDLARIKRVEGTRSWNALYQQRPVPAGGGMFNRSWFRYYEDFEDYYILKRGDQADRRIQKDHCWRFMTCDLAFTDKSQSDYTVIQVWDVDKDQNDMILVEQFRDQLQAPDVEKQMRIMEELWCPLFIGIEDRTTGTAAIQRFKRDGITIKSMKADRQKITRALIGSIWIENGKIFFPKRITWLNDLEAELVGFPHGAHDDQVDALAYAAGFSNNRNLWQEPPLPGLPRGSFGAMLGMDKIFGPQQEPPLWSTDRI